MGIAIGELLVKIGGDISELERALQTAGGQLGTFIDGTGKAALAVSTLAVAASAAGASIVAAIGGTVVVAAAARREQELLANAVRASGEAIDIGKLREQATQLGRVTEASRGQVTEMQRLLIQYGANEKQILALIPRILDFSVATKRDATDATIIFGRALTGQDQALRRVLGRFGEGVALTENFEGAMKKLDERFGGTAVTAGKDLFGALNSLQEAFSSLAKAIGTPLVQPLTVLISTMAKGVQAIADFANAHPFLIGALASMALAVAAVLLGTGGWLAWTIVLPKVVALVDLLAARFLVNAAAANLLGANLARMVIVLGALRVALIASGIGLAIFLLVELLIHWKEVVAAIASGVAFITTFLANLGRGFKTAFQEATKASIIAHAQAMQLLGAKTQEATGALRAHEESVEDLEKAYELAAAAAKELSTRQAIAATRAARLNLQTPGLTAEDIKKNEADRLEAIRDANIQELETTITAKKKLVEAINRTDEASRQQRAKHLQELRDLEFRLEDQKKQKIEETQAAAAAAVKSAAGARVQLAIDTTKIELDLLKQRLENTKDIETQRLQVEDQIRQRRLQLLQLEEQTRIAMLRRTIEIERALTQDMVSIRATILATQSAQAEAAAADAARRRAKLVEQGFLSEEDAAKEAQKEREANLQRQLEGEIKIAQERLKNVERGFALEKTLLEQETRSKLALLDQETAARQRSIEMNRKLRELDFQSALAIAKAETDAKRAEINAQFELKKAQLEAEARAARSPEERQARLDALAAFVEGQKKALGALDTALVARTKATNTQLGIINEAAADEQLSLSQEHTIKRADLERDLAANLVKLTSRNVAERAEAVRNLAEVDARAARESIDLQNELKVLVDSGQITQQEADRRLQSIVDIRDQLQRAMAQPQADVNTMLGMLDDWKKAVAERLQVLQPLQDALKNLIGGILPPPGTAAQAPALVPATIGAAPAGGPGMTFNVGDASINLTADETSLFVRLFAKLFGPEGERQLQRWFLTQPHP